MVALFHGSALRNGFVYDDHWTVITNPIIRDIHHFGSLLGSTFAREGVPDAGRPTLLATMMLDHALWGLSPRGFHVQNLVWHSGTAILVLLGLFAMGRSVLFALAGAGLFAVHPLLSETVAVINYREDLIAAFFTLASLLAIAAARNNREQGRGTIGFHAIAALCVLIGAFAKENAFVAPVLLVVLDICFFDRGRPALRWRAADYAVLGGSAAVAIVWRWWVMGAAAVVSRTAEIPDDHRRALTALPRAALAFVHGLTQLVVPLSLSPEYPEPGSTSLWLGWLALIAIGVAVAAALLLRRRAPWLAAAILCGFAAYLPTAGLVPLTNLHADRYFYLPAAFLVSGMGGLLVAALERLRPMHRTSVFDLPPSALAVAVIIMLLGMRTVQYGRVFRNDVALWSHAVAVAPDSARAFRGLGEAHLRIGETMAALQAARQAVALSNDPHGHSLMGLVLLRQGNPAGARESLRRALKDSEQHHRAEALNNLGLCELGLGDIESALHRFDEAQRLAPRFDRPWLNAAAAYEKRGDRLRALSTLRALVGRIPESTDGWRRLGQMLTDAGQKAEARAALNRAAHLQ